MDAKSLTSIVNPATRETADPVDAYAVVANSGQTVPRAPQLLREPSLSSVSSAAKKLQAKRVASAASSPVPSRESSPVRPPLKTNAAAVRSAPGPGRPRKNSTQEISPARSATPITNPPSAAATQRALSVASTPTLHSVSVEPIVRAPVPQKPLLSAKGRETPRWPISPILRSPPPINETTPLSPRKTDQDPSSFNGQRAAASAEPQEGKQAAPADYEGEDSPLISGMRTPARGVSGASSTLETVQEISQPNTPAAELGSLLERGDTSKSPADRETSPDNASTRTIKALPSTTANESGSESGGKGEIKMRATSSMPQTAGRPSGPAPKTFPGTGRGKPSGEGSARNMTVETETVSSVPQVAVGGPAAAGNNGSIRAKPSSETIRPKKEKKKTARKAPSVPSGIGEPPRLSRSRIRHHHHRSTRGGCGDVFLARSQSPTKLDSQGPFSPTNSSGATSPSRSVSQASRRTSLNLQVVSNMLTRSRPASSKADIFEAKVASAVDEANSSDSEETFVYESNPPDVSDRPRRFHSRTPSATSMVSQVDQRNGPRIMDGHHSVAMKKSMKFANSYNSNNGQPESTQGEDDGKGTARSNVGTGRGTTHHHHLGGRWGRGGGNGHPSLFDNESPFPNAAKAKAGNHATRHSSRPTSPKITNMRMAAGGKRSPQLSAAYDLDDAADDERTPLIPTVRSSRSGRVRRQTASARQMEHQAARHERSFLARFAGCLVLTVMICMVLSGAIGFMFATTQALTNVKILALKNIIASEQDLILDMKVQARNPNLVVVTIESTDLVIFAKSSYAGTDNEWWKHPTGTDFLRRALRRRDDDPLDPPPSTDPDAEPNLEIGHVYEFYSPLTFEGSPFHNAASSSLGQLRITNPGNDTTPAGSQRWGRVVQHEFDLIVQGTLKYTLPLNQKVRSISVKSRIRVKPNAADQDPEEIHISA
ncbi:hypothetical protein QTJ16_005654 [Diplocarpon rosae]|uniref:Vacuolar segregation protein 7 n=1 Tax=Diplocarpon rosae TaxID=946125 RepID=A0AAD9SX45_9HELO|nr:hypothetical protein QTJ16_005654 [Diplocarpon rosae]PBP25092.1 phospholipid metabolism enzyme regulator [Diplocarpon rosae]